MICCGHHCHNYCPCCGRRISPYWGHHYPYYPWGKMPPVIVQPPPVFIPALAPAVCEGVGVGTAVAQGRQALGAMQ